jgi:hypothetical protein
MTTKEFRQFFKTIQERNKSINSMVYGKEGRLLNMMPKLQYPVLWVYPPSMRPRTNEGGHSYYIRECTFVVLKNAKPGDTDQEDLVWDETEEITLQVLSYMKKNRKNFHYNQDSVKMDPVDKMFVDNTFGWWIDFTMDDPIELCYDESKWEEPK